MTLAIVTGSGTPGAVLTGTNPVATVAGVATFSDLSIDLAGAGYQLQATSGALPVATSASFGIQ